MCIDSLHWTLDMGLVHLEKKTEKEGFDVYVFIDQNPADFRNLQLCYVSNSK